MIINGIEFDFSTLNANDVDRMLAAQTALIHPTEERAQVSAAQVSAAQVSAAQAIPAPMNREQRRAAVKAHPAVVDFRAQEAAKAARRAQLKAELEALDNA